MRWWAAALLVTLAACSGGTGGGDTVTGRVVSVDGDLVRVRSFVVMDADGTRTEFVPAAGLQFGDGTPLSHLQEHVRDGSPVDVEYRRQDDGSRVATRVDDAG